MGAPALLCLNCTFCVYFQFRNHKLYDALRKQSNLASTLAVDSDVEVTAHNPNPTMTPILESASDGRRKAAPPPPTSPERKAQGAEAAEGASGGRNGGKDSTPSSAKLDDSSLQRGASKRRSL